LVNVDVLITQCEEASTTDSLTATGAGAESTLSERGKGGALLLVLDSLYAGCIERYLQENSN